MDCADRQNLPYKYGELKARQEGQEWEDMLKALEAYAEIVAQQ